jgi:hypothetical protein
MSVVAEAARVHENIRADSVRKEEAELELKAAGKLNTHPSACTVVNCAWP